MFNDLIIAGVVLGLLIFFFFLKKGQEVDIPPLDLLDAKKLDEMVGKQVELALKPLLQSKGYQEEEIEQILTRTSLSKKTFRR
jgi:hypothetical protein